MMHSIRFEHERATMGFVISSGTIMLTLQNAILEMIAKGEPLGAVVHDLCTRVEAAIPWTVCSVLTVKDGRMHPPHRVPTGWARAFHENRRRRSPEPDRRS